MTTIDTSTDYEDYDDGVPCPCCDGHGTVECYCGGDFCACENYGDRDCPLCHGECDVSEEVEKAYLKRRADNWAAWQKAIVRDDQQP